MTSMNAPDPGPRQLRVLVVDADDRTCESLAGLLGIGGRLKVVGGVGRPSTALEMVTSMRPDVVVVDPRLPDVDAGLDFISRLRAMAPSVRIVVMGSFDDTQPAVVAGADAFIRKTFRPNELISAIETAVRPPSPSDDQGGTL
jgi:DNA-binding NarL/FixJ family response regulator